MSAKMPPTCMSVHELHAMPCRAAPLLYAHQRLAMGTCEAQRRGASKVPSRQNACAKSQRSEISAKVLERLW